MIPGEELLVVRKTGLEPPGTAARPGLETILLVDDEPALREVLRLGLSARGYRVLEAADGREALARLDAHAEEIRLVVTDIVMPAMNGVELAREVQRRFPGLPLLLITGYSDQVPEREGQALPLLAKPFRIGELAGRIREMMDAAGARSEPGGGMYTSR